MSIIIAPDSLKGSLTAKQAAQAIQKGVLLLYPEAETYCLPFSDGGEGAIDFLSTRFTGKIQSVATTNALGKKIHAPYYQMGDKAWIELSQAAGLVQLKKEDQNPMKTSTYGVGLLIKEALNNGCRHLYLGLGGSATHDLGLGLFCALGGVVKDDQNKEFIPIGETLHKVTFIDPSKVDSRLQECPISVVCDVTNPLVGPKGAAYTFAKQKGASSTEILQLETQTKQVGTILQTLTSKKIDSLEGGGAAGGTAAGMVALFGASLQSGFDTFYEWADLDSLFQKATLLITAEGRLDDQSKDGKVPLSLALKAYQKKLPTLVICGELKLDPEVLQDYGIQDYESLVEATGSVKEAQQNAFEEVTKATCSLLKRNPIKQS